MIFSHLFIEHKFIVWFCSTARVDSLETWTIKQVACGQMHTLAVTNKGLVFAWGDNTKGQLGLGSSDTASHKHPRCIVNIFFVHAFACSFSGPLASFWTLAKQLKYLEEVGGVWSWVCEVCCGTHGILLKESPLPCPDLPGSYIFVNNLNYQIEIIIISLFTHLRKRHHFWLYLCSIYI